MTMRLPLLAEEEANAFARVAEESGFGALDTARGPLPLKGLDVHAHIDGLLADVTVTQTFVNTHREPLEATYVFPLPDRAAVTEFRLEVAGRVVEGVLQERGAARREYDRALRAGHRAAISEEERPGVFSLRVGNLPPGEAALVQLRLSGPLPYRDGEATFRFPLVVAPRYIPGTPLPGASVGSGTACDTDAVPDASRISPPVLLPGYPNPVRLSLLVDVAPSTLPVSDFRSSLHAVLQATSDGGACRILMQPGERADRDFVLRFRVGGGAVRTALTLTPDADGAAEGTFALTVLPPAGPGQGSRPRDVVFVLDRSGSMQGWKIVAARRALRFMVESLTEDDRFNVYAFDNTLEHPREFPGLGLQPATARHRFLAAEFLAQVGARGGTEMAQPLALAVHQLANSKRAADRILVLVTDGQVGNEDQILRRLAGEIGAVRVFALGIDRAVNAGFLRRLADLGGGSCELVESEGRLEEALGQIHRRLSPPVLTGLRLEPAGFAIRDDSLVPQRLPDLFAGAPLCVLGRYSGHAEGRIRLRAAVPGGGTWSETVAARAGGSAALPAVWARGHVRDLEDRFVTNRDDVRMLERQILETALRFGVLCRFTSFVAVDREETVNVGGRQRQIIQPVHAPAGWEEQETVAKSAGFGLVLSEQDPADVDYDEEDFDDILEDEDEDFDDTLDEFEDDWFEEDPGLSEQGNAGAQATSPGPSPKVEAPELKGSPSRAEEVANLEDYRRRAQDLLEVLTTARCLNVPERLHELKSLSVKLHALLEELQSVGAGASTIHRLERLFDNLQRLLGLQQPAESVVEKVWRYAEAALRSFLDAVPAASAERREAFWK
jgi:Ca-activated chloride channel family protein